MRFDLVDEPWIPVVCGGARQFVSIRGALCQAAEVDGLSVDEPLETVAVFRQVLLPVFLDAVGPVRDEDHWEEFWVDSRVGVEAVAAYLDEHRSRFDLFDGTAPFAQVSGLRTERDETKPVQLILPAEPSGNNVPLFGSRTEADPPALTAPEAARALLSAQCWDTAAIKSGAVGDAQVKAGKTTGNPTGPLGQLGIVLPMGSTLRDTLLLNTPIGFVGRSAADLPQWRRTPPTATWASRPPAGLLDLLTWQARRVRLIPELDAEGLAVVRRVVLAAGDRLMQTPDFEPHTAWRQNAKPAAGAPPSLPVRHVPGREAWRGLTAMLTTDPSPSSDRSASVLLRQVAKLRGDALPDTTRVQVLTVGVQYGNQSAVIEDVMVDSIPLPVTALEPDGPVRRLLEEVVDEAESLRRAANRLGDDLRAACGAEKLAWDQGQRLGEQLVHAFTPIVRRILGGLQQEPECHAEARVAWRTAARGLALEMAEPLLASAPPQAFFGKPDRAAKPKAGTEPRMYRLASADANYRRTIREVLGAASDRPPSSPPESEEVA